MKPNKRLCHIIEMCNEIFEDSTEVGVLPDIKELKRFRKRPFAVSGVYFLFRGDYLVYIGKSNNVMSRIASHAKSSARSHLHQKDGFSFDTYSYIYVPASDLDEVERYLINKYKPKYNDRLDFVDENGDIKIDRFRAH